MADADSFTVTSTVRPAGTVTRVLEKDTLAVRDCGVASLPMVNTLALVPWLLSVSVRVPWNDDVDSAKPKLSDGSRRVSPLTV